MEWRYLFLIISQTIFLLVLSSSAQTESPTLPAPSSCNCSDIRCVSNAVELYNATAAGDSPLCCVWDFPPGGSKHGINPLQELGYAFGLTTFNSPRFCVAYPVPESYIEMNSYFHVKLDLQGPDVCISEMGYDANENKSCSIHLEKQPVKKADYCSGVPVTGRQFVNFSIDCLNCNEVFTANFQFRVYSESFNTTQENWCDTVDKTVPSERDQTLAKLDKNDFRTEASVMESPTTPDGDNSGASRLHHTLSVFIITILSIFITA